MVTVNFIWIRQDLHKSQGIFSIDTLLLKLPIELYPYCAINCFNSVKELAFPDGGNTAQVNLDLVILLLFIYSILFCLIFFGTESTSLLTNISIKFCSTSNRSSECLLFIMLNVMWRLCLLLIPLFHLRNPACTHLTVINLNFLLAVLMQWHAMEKENWRLSSADVNYVDALPNSLNWLWKSFIAFIKENWRFALETESPLTLSEVLAPKW